MSEQNSQPNPTPTSSPSTPSTFSSSVVFLFDFLKVIVIAGAIILPIRFFVFQPFIVSGSSMEPNYSNGQYLIIDEISYHLGDPHRGDVVVLRYPNDPKQFFIKRVIGMPGEKVQIDNGNVTIFNTEYPDGKIVDEKYLPNQGLSFPHNTMLIGGKKVVELANDEYFMMGDNRLASSDSRDWGPLKRSEMIGKVFVRVLPLSKFDKFDGPVYSFK